MVFKKQQGEKLDANSTSANDWIHDVLPGILEKFNPADIFNADETGLFFRAFKDKGYCLSNGELSGGKTTTRKDHRYALCQFEWLRKVALTGHREKLQASLKD